MMKQFGVGLLCIGLILLLFIGISFLSKSTPVPELGTIVTDYALATPEGKEVKLSDFGNNILVLELGSRDT